MGQRHNRRRTRSRPRNRMPFQNNMCFPQFDQTMSTPPAFSPHAFWSSRPSYPLATSRTTSATLQKHHAHPRPLDCLETQTLRIFGGEAGDGQILCAPMLKVVMDLFNDIDYVDP
ncbi:hypothetical protein IWX90DRAFT_411477 [Phyllosticta citrichinensis]|uniref:Uncharacterized protein n=1 Tax=Phyllosticta citrichinensis TaxID=1130410 RepID=A0ABR1Y874_9PEZI